MAENIILHIESISKSFNSLKVNRDSYEDGNKHLLKNFSLFVKSGEITALIGGNGSGKTTLFNIISGFTKADSGLIYFENGKRNEISSMQPHQISRLGIGRMFQDNHIFPEMSILDNMLIADDNLFGEKAFVSLFNPRKNKETEMKRKDEAEMIFNTLFGESNHFIQKFREKAKSLSYGQQRLLGIARLMMAGNKILLLDEPTAGVNPQTIERISIAIKKMVSDFNLTVFLIEHNMKFISDIADTCAFISNGETTVQGSPEMVLKNEYVRKTYLSS